MFNDYKSSNAQIIATEGMMYNEATLKKLRIHYEDYGILSNDNTYAVKFNPNINRHDHIFFEDRPVRLPPIEEHHTRTSAEPPVAMTDSKSFIKHDYVKPPPLLPPYLNKPESPIQLQGKANEPDKGSVVYGPKRQIHTTKTVF